MGSNESNGRVTLAVLSTKLDAVIEKLDAVRASQDDHEDRLRAVETESARHGERLGIVAGLNAVLTLIASGIAGWLGSRH